MHNERQQHRDAQKQRHRDIYRVMDRDICRGMEAMRDSETYIYRRMDRELKGAERHGGTETHTHEQREMDCDKDQILTSDDMVP